MNKELLEIHSNVKDWLKFAEAKNAMLIGFNAGSVYGVAKLPFLHSTQDLGFLGVYFSIVMILLIASTVVCLISFVPRLKFILISISNSEDKNNMFFFEHLGKSNPGKLLKSLKTKGVKEEFSEIDKDIAVQIHSLANVATRKYGLFTIAIWITVAAYITIPVAGIFILFTYKN